MKIKRHILIANEGIINQGGTVRLNFRSPHSPMVLVHGGPSALMVIGESAVYRMLDVPPSLALITGLLKQRRYTMGSSSLGCVWRRYLHSRR